MTVRAPAGKVTLKSARKELRLTQYELAEKAGVSQPVISRIEQGGRGIATSYDSAHALAKVLGRPITEIYWPVGLTKRYGGRRGKTHRVTEERHPKTCPTHNITLPNTGRCDECA